MLLASEIFDHSRAFTDVGRGQESPASMLNRRLAMLSIKSVSAPARIKLDKSLGGSPADDPSAMFGFAEGGNSFW